MKMLNNIFIFLGIVFPVLQIQNLLTTGILRGWDDFYLSIFFIILYVGWLIRNLAHWVVSETRPKLIPDSARGCRTAYLALHIFLAMMFYLLDEKDDDNYYKALVVSHGLFVGFFLLGWCRDFNQNEFFLVGFFLMSLVNNMLSAMKVSYEVSIKTTDYHLKYSEDSPCSGLEGVTMDYCIHSYQYLGHDSKMSMAGVLIMMEIYFILGVIISYPLKDDAWVAPDNTTLDPELIRDDTNKQEAKKVPKVVIKLPKL